MAPLKDDEAVIKLLNVDVPVSLPVLVLGELCALAQNSSRVEVNVEKIDRFTRIARWAPQ